MKQQTHRRFLFYTAFTAEVFLLFFLGDVPGLLPAVGGALPSLLLPAAISAALVTAGELPAIAFAVLCGLLMDHSRGGPYGLSAMILAAICYAIAALTRTVLQKNLLTALLLTVPAIALVYLYLWLFLYVFPGYDGAFDALVRGYLPMAAYTFAADIPIYFLTRGLTYLFPARLTKGDGSP